VQRKSVNLLVPGLFNAFQSSELNNRLINSSFLLQRIISKADKQALNSAGLSLDYLCNIPVASHEYFSADTDTPSKGNVLYADPVHLELKSDHIVARPISIQPEDTDKITHIIAVFNEYFYEDKLKLEISESGKIFCLTEKNIIPMMVPSKDVYGRDIKHFLPEGEGAKYWLKVFNETQMLLHERLTFDQRLVNGNELNSFWFWGANHNDKEFIKVNACVGEADWIKGFCNHHDKKHVSIENVKYSEHENIYLIDESLLESSSVGDFNAWLVALAEFEKNTLQSLVKLLNAGDIDFLIFHETTGSCFKYNKMHKYRFLRKRVHLKDICVKVK